MFVEYLRKPEMMLGPPGAGITDNYDLTDVGAST